MNYRKYPSSGNYLLDEILKNNTGQVNMIIGKPRQMGKSYYNMNYNMKYLTWFRAQKRKESIKRILNI